MNKTVSINLSGFVFNIEEEAYETLKQYLDNVRFQFHNAEERDEIMADIELRIAELFQQKTGHNKEVIILADIDDIIAILGHPEDYNDGEDANESEEKEQAESTQTTGFRKRLFRDTDQALLGGVCAGLGHYFDIDKTVIRILFALLFIFFGTGILLYIILLFVVPEAKTTAEKIEMKGDFVSVESIREHFNKIKTNIADSDKHSQFRTTVKTTVNRGTEAGKSFFQILAKIFGIGLTVGGLFIFAFAIFILFGDSTILPFIGEGSIPDLQTLIHIIYPGESPSTLFFICLLTVIFIPIISFILTGLRLLFDYKHTIKPFIIGLSSTWLIAAGIIFFYSIELISDLKGNQQIVERFENPILEKDTLFVDVAHDDQFSDLIDPYNGWSGASLIRTDGEYIYQGWGELDIQTTRDTGNFSVNIILSSRGSSVNSAIRRVENIDYKPFVENGTLFIPPYLKVPQADKLRGQFAYVEIIVPQNKTVIFGSNIRRIFRHSDFSAQPHGHMSPGSVWTNKTGLLENSSNQSIEREETAY